MYIIILDSCYTVLSPILRMFAFHVNDWWLQYAINLGQLLHFCFLLPCPDRWWCRKRIIFSNSWWFIRIFERSIVCFCFSFGFWWEKVFGSLGRYVFFCINSRSIIIEYCVCLFLRDLSCRHSHTPANNSYKNSFKFFSWPRLKFWITA